MQTWKKVLLGITGSVVIIIIFIAVLSYIMLNRSLPDYDAEVKIIGLNGTVEVYRDSFAIPMIIARTDDDAAFALGYIHAQERLFQMDIARRAGEGRLSEIFGSKTIPIDKLFRTVGVYNNVKENYQKLNPLTKRILEAYTKGVNAFIESNKGNYQIEFDVLGYDPYKWKPEHSLVIAKLMAWELNISWWTDISFANIVQKVGTEKAKELLPDFPENAPRIIPTGLNNTANISTDLIDVDRYFRKFVGTGGTHIGSNNWVVSGKKSKSGKPIIANDPHLAFTAPGKWYFVIVRSKDWNVEGFTVPGLPAVVIGKNEHIAWAMTNVMADDADFYIEQIDSTGKNYFLNNKLLPIQIVKDKFSVKDSADYTFEIRKTHRGPIVSDVHLYNLLFPKDGKVKPTLSMRWTGLEFSDEIYAGLAINYSKNWDDFKEALRHFTVPGQNFIYADDKGNIGYICAAKLPIRNTASPTLVYDGSTDVNDWKGFVPYEEMPKYFNPQQNFIATANNKTVDDFKYHISNVWEPSSRIERIVELLNSKSKHSIKDFKKYQMDFISPYARTITPFIINAFKGVRINDKNLNTTLQLFENWNFELNDKSQVPTIYVFFLHHLIKNTFEDELGCSLLREYVYIANVPYRKIIELLQGTSPNLFDDTRTIQSETRDEIVRKSLSDALTDIEKKFGKNAADWQWGNAHKVTFKHFFSGQSGLLDKIIDVGPFGLGGDGTTIFNTEYSFPELFDTNSYNGKKFSNTLGPSMRYIYDFSQPGKMDVILPTGQSGHFMNEHYKDMIDDWLNGRYVEIPLVKKDFIEKSKHLMKLVPGRNN